MEKVKKVIKLKDGSKAVLNPEKDKYIFGITMGTNLIQNKIDCYRHKTKRGQKTIDYLFTYNDGKPIIELLKGEEK